MITGQGVMFRDSRNDNYFMLLDRFDVKKATSWAKIFSDNLRSTCISLKNIPLAKEMMGNTKSLTEIMQRLPMFAFAKSAFKRC